MQMVKAMRYLFFAVAISVMATVAPLHAADGIAALLDEAPAGAEVVVVVPSLSRLSEKVAALHDDLGLTVPPMKDLLGELKRAIGIDQGLNDEGGVLIAFTDLAGAIQAQADEPPALLLVEVKDYEGLVTGLGGQAGAEVASLTLAQGQAAFVKKSGSYAVLGADMQLVQGYQPGGQGAALLQTLGATAAHLDTADGAVIVNIAALAPAIEPFIDQAAEEMGREMANARERAQGPEAQMVEFGSVAVSMYIDAARAILRDSQAGVAAFELTDGGLSITEALQFKPESTLGTMFANGTAAAEQLARLPDQPYLMAGAWNTRGLVLDPLFDATQKLLKAMPEDVLGGMSEMVESSVEMAKSVKSGAMVYYPPQQMAMMGGGMMMGIGVVETTDPQAYIQTYQDAITKLNGLSFGAGDEDNPGIPGGGVSIVATYKSNVLQVDGVEVDEYQLKYQYPPQMMQQMGPMAPIFMMMGGMGQSGYIAVKGRYVVMTTARDAELINQALASVDGGNGMGSAGVIKQVRDQGLPADACFEAHLSVSGLVGMGNMFMGMMGQPPLQVPDDLPPVSWGATVKDHAVVTKAYVPIDVMRFVKNVVDQVQARAAPGGGPGGQPNGGAGGDGPPPAPF